MIAKPTVLVTGGCGYIGSHVTLRLSEAGYKVVVIDNLSTGSVEALLHNETFYHGDVGDRALLEKVFTAHPIKAVLHFAASIFVEDSTKDPLSYYQNNTAHFIELLKVASQAQVEHMIFSSTAAVYKSGDGQQSLSESAETQPENPYGRSKLMDEWILKDLAKIAPLRFVILRYFNVAGADAQCRIGLRGKKASHLIKVACEVAVGKRPSLSIYGNDYPTADGTCVRDYVHVEDLADAHISALRYLEAGQASTTLNCGYGHGYSVKEVVEAFHTATGVNLNVQMGARRSGDPASLVANNAQILKTLDWRAQRDDLALIIRSALAWEKKILRS